jgi:hypothetical protein
MVMIKEIEVNLSAILLNLNKVVMVDYKYLYKILEHKWYAVKSSTKYKPVYYVMGRINGRTNYLARFIMEIILGRKLKQKEIVDHIDGDPLKNYESNLRAVDARTNAQNRHNERTSEFAGVSMTNKSNSWRAAIHIKDKCKYIGTFERDMVCIAGKLIDVGEIKASMAYLHALKEVNEGKSIEDLTSFLKIPSGCKGVNWNKNEKKWIVRITVEGLRKSLGYFKDKNEAIKIRKNAEFLIKQGIGIDDLIPLLKSKSEPIQQKLAVAK